MVPAGVIFKEDDPTVTNDELSVEFEVPEVLGYVGCSLENSTLGEHRYIRIYFDTPTAIVENGEITLCRNGIPIKKDPVDAGYENESGLGFAGMNFVDKYSGGVSFESGFEYTLRLSKGGVSTASRPDITNEEVSVNFLGNYIGNVEPVMYTGCSLNTNKPLDVLGEVSFYYKQSTALTLWLCANPTIQLYNGTDGVVVKDVVPTLSERRTIYAMTMDFGNVLLVSGKEYFIIIPEATVVAVKRGNWMNYLTVNQCNTVSVVNNSGVSEIEDTDCNINVENGSVTIDGISAGVPVTLLSLDGKVLYNARSNGATVSIPVGTTGIYLLSVNGKTHKIAVSK